ncbi:hypothetical protein COT50_02630 [candidate division WWE3 bacterium CG08_land_8_20_14_0_20_41_10]|uniref:NYN domain-containing protein n=1 Tax=candidate division WWE3 bacterium CG08_land_8_20_14_0_20_41_10 TaxID=1975085 RepID=A0A2H0XBZ5_UNCKA|nr:MAG: hypothetical protein COT50_02630 [candidate division WWE3 bacterium CG08_land_8_20_14_0_20_41_10]
MPECILFVDGENLLHKIKEVNSKIDLSTVDLNGLLSQVFSKHQVPRKIFYASKLRFHPDFKKKSQELIKFQRKLRNNLVAQGYEFTIAGNVRAQKLGSSTVFREKGVDVKIAVDMVSLACDKKLDVALLCSSDSDLQPAITEMKNRGVKVVYIGFENNPNKGLIYTTDETILLKATP